MVLSLPRHRYTPPGVARGSSAALPSSSSSTAASQRKLRAVFKIGNHPSAVVQSWTCVPDRDIAARPVARAAWAKRKGWVVAGANGIGVGWRQKPNITLNIPLRRVERAQTQLNWSGVFLSFHLFICLTPRLRACDKTRPGRVISGHSMWVVTAPSPSPSPSPPSTAALVMLHWAVVFSLPSAREARSSSSSAITWLYHLLLGSPPVTWLVSIRADVARR